MKTCWPMVWPERGRPQPAVVVRRWRPVWLAPGRSQEVRRAPAAGNELPAGGFGTSLRAMFYPLRKVVGLSAIVLAVFACWFSSGISGGAAEPAAGTLIVHPADGARMVYVPAGKFIMGLAEAEANVVAQHLGAKDAATLWAWDCYPRRTVELPGYFIDECEATVARWKQFVAVTGHKTKFKETTRHFDHPEAQSLPAGEITWDEAKAYARWAGKALPTDAQWEKAARGTDGRLYPWGNDAPTPDHGHIGAKGKQPPLYTQVGSYPKGRSPYGVLDLIGNQYEWTADWLVPYPGNPQAEKMRDYGRVVSLRGGSWYHGWVGFYAAKRFGFKPDETYYHVGFRTVWTPPAGYFDSPEFARDRAAAAGTETVPPSPIYRASVAPVIDGKLDDPCWKQAVPVAVAFPFAAPGQRTQPPPVTARFAWDERYLYIAYEVNDTNLVAIASGRESGPPGNRRPMSEEYLPEKKLDLVEFFISFGSVRTFWEIHHNAANHLNNLGIELPTAEALAKIPKPSYKDVTFHRERYVDDDGAFTVARAVQLKPRADGRPSTVNDPSDRDTGYAGEIRLPWAGLGAPAERRRADGSYDLKGLRLPLLAAVLNGNTGDAVYHSSAPYLPTIMFHFSVALWPRYELVDAPK